MDIAARIDTIDRASAGLVQYNKARLQLILRQFGATTYDWQGEHWAPTDLEYVVSRLEGLDDMQLVAIDAFVAGDMGNVQGVRNPESARIWTECPTGVFLSHKFEDAEFASSISAGLMQYGIEGFVAHNDIAVSDPWRGSIMDGLDTCDAFVALMHDKFHESEWCDQEVGWALGRHIPVLVVRPTSVSSPRNDGFIEQIQHMPIDRANPSCVEFTVTSIFNFLAGRPELHERVAESLVWALERPQSHPHAIKVWYAMKALDFTWPDALLRRIRVAKHEQGFVRDAYTIPAAPYQLLKGFSGSALEAELASLGRLTS